MAIVPARKKLPAREKLLKAAGELFYDHGITATGIDAVIGQQFVDFELIDSSGAATRLGSCLNGLPTLFVFVR